MGKKRQRTDVVVAGRYVLPVPSLLYPHEFDPDPDIIEMERQERRGRTTITRTVKVPIVRIQFPAQAFANGKPKAVLGLPKPWVQWVLDQEFAVPYAAIPTVEYLFALAQNLAGHPLLNRFDTAVRDGLHSLPQEAIYRAFWLLSDYLIGDDLDDRWLWGHLATYVFWAECTSVGTALPFWFAKLDDCAKKTRNRKHAELIASIRERDTLRKR